MLRSDTSHPALVEARARTDRALEELYSAIREASDQYERLGHRLEDFDRRLEAARITLRAAGHFQDVEVGLREQSPAPQGGTHEPPRRGKSRSRSLRAQLVEHWAHLVR